MNIRRKNMFIAIILTFCLLPANTGCSDNTSAVVSSSVSTPESTVYNTSIPATTPEPTSTPIQTSTPIPTPTPTPEPTPTPIQLVEYDGVVPHIFFHCLIAFPEIAYSKGINGALDTDCVTVSEFKRCLDALYQNNYILIDVNSIFEVVEENGKEVVKDKKVMIPAGKTPIVLSIDDMVYDPNKMGWGMVDKIILDADGNFATYTKHKSGEEVVSYDNEVIPILDGFIKKHPDFSLNGAKATLALTGFAGILGYRIDSRSPNRDQEIEAVKPIVARLKETGWTFASHGYGHKHSKDVSYSLFANDTLNWKNVIEPVTGPTRIYIYPYGQTVPRSDPKYRLMLDYGFKVMCGVNTEPIWKNYGSSVFMGRQCIDGYSLRNYKTSLAPYFNIDDIIDLKTRGQ